MEVLHEIRQEMAREADYDVDLFAEMVRTGSFPESPKKPSLSDELKRSGKPRRGRVGSEAN
ncbi:MAG: hypothetical protein IPJ30_20350 [Acidobacteria bacterium]|nr:hypothetical protein [Acidobacteriota bacterium]MBK8150203.1 hypothetical protein [Acidobacteriota bacterium]